MPIHSILNAAIIYEDLEMGELANRMCHSMACEFGVQRELNQEMWNFQLLDVAEFQAQATRAAACADLIVVATHGYEELPLEILAWIEYWVDKRQGHPGALVALFDEIHPHGGSRAVVQSYLEYVARRCGLDFVSPSSPAKEVQRRESFRAREHTA